MSKLEKILIDTLFINNYDVVWGHDDARQQIKALILELIDDAHATTTTLNTMPLVSSYRAVDDMRKFARQKVEDL